MPVTRWTPQNVYAGVTTVYRQAAAAGVIAAKAAAPKRTGLLRSSITYLPAGPLSGYMVAPMPYAASQDTGSKPHDIGGDGQPLFLSGGFYPSQSAADTAHATGGIIVRGPVHHPGTQGTGYLSVKGREGFLTAFMAGMRKVFGL